MSTAAARQTSAQCACHSYKACFPQLLLTTLGPGTSTGLREAIWSAASHCYQLGLCSIQSLLGSCISHTPAADYSHPGSHTSCGLGNALKKKKKVQVHVFNHLGERGRKVSEFKAKLVYLGYSMILSGSKTTSVPPCPTPHMDTRIWHTLLCPAQTLIFLKRTGAGL